MTEDVLILRDRRAGRIRLNRPGALNALTHGMIGQISAALSGWADDPGVAVVLIEAAGTRAFCAGGDLRALYRLAEAGNHAACAAFWRDEYRLNAQIAGYGKPVVALMQGLVLGGGVGLGCHASHRVVGHHTLIATPECSIGLVPDAGATLLLAAAPGHLGEYLGLSGARMTGADAIYSGFADDLVPEADWPKMIDAVCDSGNADAIAPFRVGCGVSALAARRPEIDALFATGDPAPDADFLDRASPLSALATLRLIRNARALDRIEPALEAEFRFVCRALTDGDFAEGIRARIIDKDDTPRWRHKAIDKVPVADVANMLAPLPFGQTVFGTQPIREGNRR